MGPAPEHTACAAPPPPPPPPPLYWPFAHAGPELQLKLRPVRPEISLRRAENEGLERTEEEAYVLIANGCLQAAGRKGESSCLESFCLFPSKYGVQP